MKILAERIIEVLVADATLVALLGSSDNIAVESAPSRKAKAVFVSSDPGLDGNNIPTDSGTLVVTAVVSRAVDGAGSVCMNIADRVDALLNKTENVISDNDWDILHMIRKGGSGLEVDDTANEYWFQLDYEYILTNS